MTNTQHFKAVLLLASACAFSLPTFAGTVDTADFCVTETEMQLDIRLSALDPDVFDIIFQISPDAGTFTAAARESLSVNFDMHTGAITRQEPIVRTNGEPETDRWVDGPIDNFTIVATGDGFAQLSGSVLLGNDKLLPGGTIKSIGLRDPDTVVQGPHAITACAAPPPVVPLQIVSISPTGQFEQGVSIDGELEYGEWRYHTFATQQVDEEGVQNGWLKLPNGVVMFRFDRARLLVLVDIQSDNFDDPPDQGGQDNVWLLFDVNKDGQITDGIDVRYRLEIGSGNLLYETFAAGTPNLEFNPPADSTLSSRAAGFGCFVDDLSLFPSIPIQPPFDTVCNRHRVWEFAIDRREIGAEAINSSMRIGVAVQSGAPALNIRLPADIGSLGDYAELKIVKEKELHRPPELLPAPLMEVAFTQGIEPKSGSLPRVRNKSSAIRITPIDATGDQKYRVALYGKNQGVDLPGSPRIGIVKSTLIDGLSKYQLHDYVVLPDSWLVEGASYQAVTYDHGKASLPIVISGLVDTKKPTYWVIPTKLSKVGNAFTPTQFSIPENLRHVNESFPLGDVDWVLRSPISSVSVDSPGLKTELQEMYDGVLLAWVFGVIGTGSPTFTMPDMILSAVLVDLCSGKRKADCNKAGGSSSPVWSNSQGRVAWGNVNIERVFAHEINHNLDRASTGTWGKHVPFGCDAPGTDPQWPYTNDAINGFGTTISKSSARYINFNPGDFMTYCPGSTWISPYRWSAMLDNAYEIPTQVAFSIQGETTTVPAEVLYLSGTIDAAGGGSINPLIMQPGTISEPLVAGRFRLQQLACDDTVLSEVSFAGFFEDVEGGALEQVHFNYRLLKATGVCAVQLLDADQLLAERRITVNAPTVVITSPTAGVNWDGISTISWTANDADDDPMQYIVFYSPDDGMTWVYLAGPINGTQLQVDSATLPGSTTAQVRVVATDGFNTSVIDTVEPFSVEASGPRTLITSHYDLQKVVVGQPVLLEGVGYDAMGHALGGDSYRWFIDGEFAGIGSELPTELELGEYLIEFFAVGADDLTGSDSIHLLVVTEEIFIDNFE